MRNLSNASQLAKPSPLETICRLYFNEKRLKIGEFFRIAELFTCHHAQITMKVNQDRDILSHGSIREAGEETAQLT